MIKEVLTRREPAIVGQPASLRSDQYVRSMVNDRPRTAQVSTITATAVNSTEYTVTVDGITVNYTSDGSASTAEIVAGLVAALNGEPVIAAKTLAAVTGAATLTITARIAGVGFEASVGANLSLASTTANDEPDALAFGAACFEAGAALVSVADSALFPARTATTAVLTPAVANNTAYSVTIVAPDGNSKTYTIVSDGSATAKKVVDALTAAINAGQAADTVEATDDDSVLTLTAESASYRFTLGISSTLSMVFTAGSGNTDEVDVASLFAGVAVRDSSTAQPAAPGVIGYKGGTVCSIMSKGDIWVPTVNEASINADVFVGVTGSAKGKFRSSAAAGYVRLPRSRARWERVHSPTFAVLSLN